MSPHLRDTIAEHIAAQVNEPFPRSFAADRDVLFLHGNQAFFWFLTRDGDVVVADHDTFAMRLEPETDRTAAEAALAAAAARVPALAELLVRNE